MHEDFSLRTKVFINVLMLSGIVGILACANVIAICSNPNIAYVVGIVTGISVIKLLKLIFKSIKEDVEGELYKFRREQQLQQKKATLV